MSMSDAIPTPTATKRFAVERQPHSPLLQATLEAEFDNAADAAHFVLDFAYDGTFGLTVYDRVLKQHNFWVNVRTDSERIEALWAETLFGDHLAILRSISLRYPGIYEAQESPSTIYLISVILQLVLDSQKLDWYAKELQAANQYADAERQRRINAEKRVVALEHEIDRVAGFLQEHEFPGYSFGLPRRGVWDGKASQDGE